MKRIIHVDMDAFFASIEIARNPSLKGKPIVITNSMGNRGVVSTASYEAREFGIHSGMSLKRAKRLCKNLIVIKGNFSLYSEISEGIMRTLSNFTDRMEIRSIDEAYLDVTETENIFGGAVSIGKRIKRVIKERFNLTCSVGISYNKLLAKIATELSKPDGLLEIKEKDLERYYYPLPIEKIPGIGKRSVKLLKEFGINKVSDIRKFGYEDLIKNFKPHFTHFLIMISKGEGEREVNYKRRLPKSISSRITLEKDTRNMKLLESILSRLSEDVGKRLRGEKLMGKTVKITVRYSDFKTETHQRKLPFFIDSDSDILNFSLNLLKECIKDKPVRLLGITVSSIIRSKLGLFLFEEDKREERFLKVIDRIKEKFGEEKIFLGKSIIKK